ncbi:2635_t:CDS:1, partial [Acaulospora morrowiae]
PMASCQSLNVIEAGLRDLMQNSVPFGGKIIILGGDFRQVLPIVRHGSCIAQVNASLKRSSLWALFQKFQLNQNMRVKEDEKKFSKWLLQLGDESLSTVNGEIQLPP